MAANLPMQTDVAQGLRVTRYIHNAISGAYDDLEQLSPSIAHAVLEGEVAMACRRWAAQADERRGAAMPARIPEGLGDGALQALLHQVCEELEVRGYCVTYGVGGPSNEFGLAAGTGTNTPKVGE